MGYFQQVKLLLWKNYILKKRLPHILILETVIPFILFIILGLIRQHELPMPTKTGYMEGRAFPSSGIVSVMQTFCYDSSSFHFDGNGLPVLSENSSLYGWLESVNNVVKGHYVLTADYSLAMFDAIPSHYEEDVDHYDAIYRRFDSVNNISYFDILKPVSKNNKNGTSVQSLNLSSVASLVDRINRRKLSLKDTVAVLSVLNTKNDVTKSDALSRRSLIHYLIVPMLNAQSRELNETIDNLINETVSNHSNGIMLPGVIDNHKLADLLNVTNSTGDALMESLMDLAEDLDEFTRFHSTLDELAGVVAYLPLDACVDPNQPLAPDNTNSTKKSKATNFGGLIKIFQSLQPVFCPNTEKTDNPQGTPPTTPTPKTREDDTSNTTEVVRHEEPDSAVTGHLQILSNILNSNPKILYTPSNTSADLVMKQANKTFEFIDHLSLYARHWLNNISTSLREFISKPDMDKKLNSLKRTQKNLMTLRQLAYPHSERNMSSYFDALTPFLTLHIKNSTQLLSQIDLIDRAACSWVELMSGANLSVFMPFAKEYEAVDYALYQAYKTNVTVMAIVVFEVNSTTGLLDPHTSYKIRMNSTFLRSVRKIRPLYWSPQPRNWDYNYYTYGFSWIQDVIDRAIIDLLVGHEVVEPGIFGVNFPYPCYQYDIFLFTNDMILPLCMTISFVYTAAIFVQNVVAEKENRLKEFMKVMGLSNSVHGMAWFLTAFVQLTFSMTAVTLLLKFSKVLLHSNPFIIWLILELYAIATITFCFLVSSLFSKAKIASATAGIMYFLSYVPAMYIGIREDISGGQMSSSVKQIASLLSTSAFGLSCKYISLYESESVGVQWDNISISPIEHDTFSLSKALFFMGLDAALYALCAWYIEHIHPGSYGIPKPWYFPLTKHFWMGTPGDDDYYEKPPFIAVISNWLKKICRCSRPDLSIIEDDQLAAMSANPNASDFESEPNNLPLGVDIENLTKVYKKTGKLAVNKLSLKLYESQITGLLGHNGAGKTSTMSVLTGILPPSSGTARIYGLDIRSNLDTIRFSVGYCPQYNVLFDGLTGEEHLLFYSGLRRATDAVSRMDVQQMLDDVGLTVKRSTPVNHLSGGMKRKLSVALAFIAQSRLVILDEPTAGVDPFSRRAIWDLIIKYKKGRTILLSTHHMDEADVLSDRIAIISNGRLKCCGSSIFLRNQFCDGYHLICVKDAEHFDWLETMSFLKKALPSSFLHMESKQELHFVIPYSEERSRKFVNFFNDLNLKMSELGLSSYGVYDSTLEEAFLRITQTAQCEEGETFIRRTTSSHRHYRGSSAGSFTSATSRSKYNNNNTQQPSSDRGDLPLINCATGGRGGHSRQSSDISNCGLVPSAPTVTRRHGGGHSRQSSADSALLNVVDKAPMPEKRQQHDATSLLSAADVFALLGSSAAASSSNNYSPSASNGFDYTALCATPPRFIHLKHVQALMIKRFLYVKRNWKVLFSQIFLPAIFVSIAMSMALSAPNLDDPPPLVLSPAQYYNYTQPRGNFVPVSNYAARPGHEESCVTGPDGWSDANSAELAHTLHLPSGISATCVLRSPHLLMDLSQFNFSKRDYQLVEKYFNKDCGNVFVRGLPLVNFLPPPPSSATPPLDYSSTVTTLQTTPSPEGNVTSTKKPTGAPLFYPICHCASDSSGFYCSNDYVKAPEFQLITGDYIVDIGHQNMTEYLLYTSDEYRLHRYGALTFGSELNFIPKDFGNGLPTEFRRLAVRRVGFFSFNHRGYHSLPSFLNAMNNAILRANLQKKPELGNPAAYGITVYNHPINGTDKVEFQDMATQGTDTMISVFIIIAMSFVPASFVVFLVYERSLLSKHTQLMAGLHPITYWLTNYIWDLLNYLIPSTCCIIILVIFDIPAYVAGENLPAIILLFLLYGWSITPMMYPATFYLSDPSTAYIILVVINLFVGTTCVITSFLLDLFHNSALLAVVHNFLKIAFLVSPSYCLGRGLMDVAINQYKNEFYVLSGQLDKIASPFAWETTMRSYVVMFCEGFIFLALTLILEYVSGALWSSSDLKKGTQKKRRTWTPPSVRDSVNDDADVVAERHRVLSGGAADDILVIDGLTKEYSSKAGRLLAVDRLTVGMSSGECFGLLGLNGAGKSTTFSMLTGVLSVAAGQARIGGNLLCGSGGRPSARVMRSVGYCPQTDPLLDELTAREHLQLYARIRGIPSSVQSQIVTWLLERMGLELYADKPSRTFSGGTRRKLSAALALLGNPSIILLDEPTTGMDPGSRRFLWNLILELRHENRLVVLTSHSMEECEVLCSRLGVMVAGKLRCLGSTQQLKSKFGKGYSVLIRLPSRWLQSSGPSYGYRGVHTPTSTHQSPSEMITDAFTQAGIEASTWRMVARRHQIVELEVLERQPNLSVLFRVLYDMRQDRRILDFSVSQNTLDSVFLQLAREHEHLQVAAHMKRGGGSCNSANTTGSGGTASSSVTITDPSTVVWADDELIEERDEELLLDPVNDRMRLEIVN